MKIGILDPEGINLNPLNGLKFTEEYKKLAQIWSRYPTYAKADEIISTIKDQKIDVLLIISGTGSGKTVLIPKFALHALNYGQDGKIALTFPKRIITLSSAQFAAKTLDVQLGKEIGYIFKGAPSDSISDKTKMIYMTDGSLVSMISKDPLLMDYGCIIIDEAHERKTQIDFLLLLMKKIIAKRKQMGKPIKLVIMSATIDPSLFLNYFPGTKKIDISGQPNYPIDIIYPKSVSLDYLTAGIEIIKEIVSQRIQNEKREDILFFVTSGSEAISACKILKEKGIGDLCVEVYSDMPDEKKSLLKIVDSDKGKVKIYIATNVAESSITFDGITHVIDSGLELFSSYDPNSMARLLNRKQITKAQALQRSGRVGRTEPGTCYRLYSKEQFELFEDYPLPDIKKSDLTSDLLRLLEYVGGDFRDLKILLKELIDPPSDDMISSAESVFKSLKIIDDLNTLTTLGKKVVKFSSLPVNLAVSLVLSYKLFCAYDFSLLVSLMEYFSYDISNIFHSESDTNQRISILKKIADESGDHITLLKLYKKIDKSDKKEEMCRKYCLKIKAFLDKDIKNKAMKYFRTLKEIHNEQKEINKEQIGGENHKLDKKAILKALVLGGQTNIAKFKDTYYTIFPKKTLNPRIQRESVFGVLKKEPTLVMYQELFIMNGIAEMKFTSKISSKLLYEI